MNLEVPLVVIGGRGPHGLAWHLLMRDRGLEGSYALVDHAKEWLPSYGSRGPMQHTEFLRSPHEFDFALGAPSRSMHQWRDGQGQAPLANVYTLAQAEDAAFNEHDSSDVNRAPRKAFHAYAQDVAFKTQAHQHVIHGRVTCAEPKPDGWMIQLDGGRQVHARVILLATGIAPHRYVPERWRTWWRHLPDELKRHSFDGPPARSVAGRRVAILGSSNSSSWETALSYASLGAKVTLLSRHPNPVERQFPFPVWWVDPTEISAFAARPSVERLRILKKTHIPRSAVPGTHRRARSAGIRIVHHARVRHVSEVWSSAQVVYDVSAKPRSVERFDLIVAATGASPRIRDVPFLRAAAQTCRAPVHTSGPARNTPILDHDGRWKNLPPIYPLGAFMFGRVGYAALTLASATRVLPLMMDPILHDAGIKATRS